MQKVIDGEAFFVIDSNNLKDVEAKLYGFALDDDKLILNQDIDDNELDFRGDGLYVNVYETSDSIVIEQDFMGSWGLYLYESSDGQHYAISNSFVKLVDYLKDRYEITFNKRFAESWIFSELCSISYDETFINEIRLLPRIYKVVINKDDRKITYEKIDYKEHSVDIDSKEGIELLDKWFNKWVNIIRFLRDKSNDLRFDLTGGYDSRVSAALWLSADISLDNICINSTLNNYAYPEDYEIASQIAEEFGFELNGGETNYYPVEDLLSSYNNNIFTRLGSENITFYHGIYSDTIVYSLSGFCGETLRGVPNPPKMTYIGNMFKRIDKMDPSIVGSSGPVIESTLNKIADDYSVSPDDDRIMNMHYKETRNRYHFGKYAVESMFTNRISLTPLMDPYLHKLKTTTDDCDDKLLKNILIISRYCPKLLDFKIEGGRKFRDDTIEYAQNLNKRYPFKPTEKELIKGPEVIKRTHNKGASYSGKINRLLGDVFDSDRFEEEFLKHFSTKNYYSLQKLKTENNKLFLRALFGAVSCLRIIRDVEGNTEYGDDIEWLESFLVDEDERSMNKDVKGLLTPFATAIIHVKNHGNENNDVEITNVSDRYASFFSYSFIEDDGSAVIESYKGEIDFDIKCIKSGNLTIWLRAKSITDKNKNAFPLYIDYRSLKINDEEYIDGNKVVSSERLYPISFDVEDGDILHFHAEWRPFNQTSEYENIIPKKVYHLKQKNEKANRELDKTKKELEEARKKLNELQNSKKSIRRLKDKFLGS